MRDALFLSQMLGEKMDRKVKNISDLLKVIGVDKHTKEATENEIKKRSIAKFLFTLRCDHNLTQKQLADKMKCTQSKISKLESAYDSEINVQDLLDYATVLGFQLEIGYRSKHMKTETIKGSPMDIRVK